jgi:hypothetical protein
MTRSFNQGYVPNITLGLTAHLEHFQAVFILDQKYVHGMVQPSAIASNRALIDDCTIYHPTYAAIPRQLLALR